MTRVLTTDLNGVVLRPWRSSDRASIVRYANNRKVWLNLKDRFPHPYRESDAEAWIAYCSSGPGQPFDFAIDREGTAIGGIGIDPLDDVHRLTANIGYWLGEPFWGQRITTSALKVFTPYVFATFPFERLQGMVFEWNPASARVLEKCGFTLEARLRRGIVKDDRVGDGLLYARLRE